LRSGPRGTLDGNGPVHVWWQTARIEVRDVLDLTVTIDHNVVDGAPATRFTADLRRLIHTAAVLAPAAPPGSGAVR